MRKLKPWLATALALSGSSLFILALLLSNLIGDPSEFKWILASFGLAMAWVLLLIPGVCFLRWRGCWLLFGLPGTLPWLLLIGWLVSLP